MRSKNRRMKKVAVPVLASAMMGLWGCTEKATIPETQRLTVVSYGGGAYQESHKKAFCEPFELYTGVKVESTTWGADYGKLKAMVQQGGRVPWDVVEVTAAQFERGKQEGLFERLIVTPPSNEFLPNTVSDYGVANVYWGTVLGYSKAKYVSKAPGSWADFFDVEAYPGSRALYDDPRANLEFALLADGVALKDLYPLDVDRAFRVLDRVKPYVRVWWTDSSQPLQLLMAGSVDMSTVWNGRIFASKDARREIGYSWNGAALELDYWIVPKGARNGGLGSRFIAYASSPYAMAKQAEIVGYGPANKESLRYVSPEVLQELPTADENWKLSFVVDADWWAQNEETVKTRWLSWKAQ